jgi:hypothetical protein
MSRFVDVTPKDPAIWEGACWVDMPALEITYQKVKPGDPKHLLIHSGDYARAGGTRLFDWCHARGLALICSDLIRPGRALFADFPEDALDELLKLDNSATLS